MDTCKLHYKYSFRVTRWSYSPNRNLPIYTQFNCFNVCVRARVCVCVCVVGMIWYLYYCLLQWTVCGATGVFGANVTSAVVPEQAHEPDHAHGGDDCNGPSQETSTCMLAICQGKVLSDIVAFIKHLIHFSVAFISIYYYFLFQKCRKCYLFCTVL